MSEGSAVTLRSLVGAVLLTVWACGGATEPKHQEPSQIVITSGDQQEGRVGQELPTPLVVRVVDTKGNPVEGVSVAFAVTSGKGSVRVNRPTDVSGNLEAIWTLGLSTADTHAVTAQLGGTNSSDKVAPAVFSATALPDVADRIQRASEPTSGMPGHELDSLRVKVLDKHGNAVPGVTLRWRVTRGGGGISPEETVTTETGSAAAHWTLGPNTGHQEVETSVVDDTIRTEFALVAGLESVAMTSDSLDLEIGESMTLIVKALDHSGNDIPELTIGWASDRTAVVTVDSTGTVTAVAPGVAKVTATVGAQSASTRIVVLPKAIKFKSVSVGFLFTCAIATSDQAYCWGRNGEGQLGNDGRVDSSVPVRVSGNLLFTSLSPAAGGQGHVCGATSSAEPRAYCWGNGYYGQLGNGKTLSSAVPGPVEGDIPFVLLSTGDRVSCGIAQGGAGYCWGYNQYYMLGNGSPYADGNPTPQALVGNIAFSEISVGRSLACGLTGAGALYCWGSSARDYTGSQDRNIPKLVNLPYGESVTAFSVGDNRACILTESGAVYCGRGNTIYELGPWPTKVNGLPPIVQIATGNYSTCGLTADGEAFCWGLNEYGQLGNGTMNHSTFPVRVKTDVRFTSISVEWHACGLTADGDIYCWGRNDYGQIGAAATKDCRKSTTELETPCNLEPVKVNARE